MRLSRIENMEIVTLAARIQPAPPAPLAGARGPLIHGRRWPAIGSREIQEFLRSTGIARPCNRPQAIPILGLREPELPRARVFTLDGSWLVAGPASDLCSSLTADGHVFAAMQIHAPTEKKDEFLRVEKVANFCRELFAFATHFYRTELRSIPSHFHVSMGIDRTMGQRMWGYPGGGLRSRGPFPNETFAAAAEVSFWEVIDEREERMPVVPCPALKRLLRDMCFGFNVSPHPDWK